MPRRNNDNQHCRFIKRTREIYTMLEDGFLEVIEDNEYRKLKTMGEVLGYERIRTTSITRGERRRTKREKKQYSSKSRMNNCQHPLSEKRFKKNGGRKHDPKTKGMSKAIQDDTRKD